MKFLAFGDSHGSDEAHEILRLKTQEEKPELLVCIGDFTIFGMEMKRHLKNLVSIAKEAKIKLVLIHGNHESLSELEKEVKKYPEIVWLHKNSYEYGKFTFIGYGGGGFTNRDSEFVDFIKPHAKIKDQILLTHQPPKDTTLDEVWEDHHVGNQDFTDYIKKAQPILALSGHIHETFEFQDLIKESLLLNPGPTGQVIEIPEDEHEDN